MLSIGRETAPEPSPPETCPESFPRLHLPDESLLSPSIQRQAGERVPAFELKFLISEEVAERVEAWASAHLLRDAFGNSDSGGSYHTTTLYLDTPNLDVFHRSPGFRGRKFRVRRYGLEPMLYLERKTRRKDRVNKRRSNVALDDLTALSKPITQTQWQGAWFQRRTSARALRPACRISYARTAFVKAAEEGPLRVTLDRQIRGVTTDEWNLTPVEQGYGILPEQVVCEFKFRAALPTLFREAIAALGLQVGSISKYRRVMTAAGVAPLTPAATAMPNAGQGSNGHA